MKNIIILTHKDCIDGFAAAWVIYYYYYLQESKNMKYSLKYIFVDPSNPEDAIYEFKEYADKFGCYKAYSFDIGFNHIYFQKIYNIFSKIVILDHHISSYNDIKENINPLPKNYIFDNNKSGATLAWEYFYPDQECPKLLQYIEDRDLWKFNLPNSKIITEGIYSFLLIGNFNLWTEFIENEEKYLKKCEKLGRVLIDIKEKRNAILVDQGKIIKINKLNVFIINTTENISDLGSYICNLVNDNGGYMVDYALIWRYSMLEEKFYVSLRSRSESDIDVSKLAKDFSNNGGGHKHAAGFSCSNIFDILDKKNVVK